MAGLVKMGDLSSAEYFWDCLARQDPLWAILSDPTRRSRRWDLDSFFRTGEREISTLIYQLDTLLGALASRRSALDFGCGVGRLSQALSRYFDRVVGIDISAVMIEHARRLNRRPGQVIFVHNRSENLRCIGNERFDLIYSDLVFQHLPPHLTSQYMRECLDLLEPNGLLVFQLPSHPRADAQRLVVPMPDEAYRHRMSVGDCPPVWTSGALVDVRLSIENASPCDWDQRRVGPIRVGNHWLGEDGSMLVQDDGRSELPTLLRRGERADVVLRVTVPEYRGDPVLELDLVHEGFSWFKDRGGSTLVVSGSDRDRIGERQSAAPPTALARPLDLADTPASEAEIAFPMFAIPRDEVLLYLQQLGGEVLLVEDDDRGGRELAGYRYFVRRPARSL